MKRQTILLVLLLSMISIVAIALVVTTGDGRAVDSNFNDSRKPTTENNETGNFQAPLVDPEERKPLNETLAVVTKIGRVIESRVPEDFFEQYVTFGSIIRHEPDINCNQNTSACNNFLKETHYHVQYEFEDGGPELWGKLGLPEMSYVQNIFSYGILEEGKKKGVHFVTDKKGEIFLESVVERVPDCTNNPNECDLSIDAAQALDIAKKAGFEEGVRNWSIAYAFHIEGTRWVITNSSSYSECSGAGKNLEIDPNSGEVIRILDWVMSC